MPIWNGYAFESNLKQKAFDNDQAYKRIPKGKYKTIQVIRGYNSFEQIIQCDVEFCPIEMLLWADDGNLCFGGTFEGSSLDINRVMQPGTYKVRIFTD